MSSWQKRVQAYDRWIGGILLIGLLIVLAVWAWLNFGPGRHVYAVDVPITASPADCTADTRLAVIGDFGDAGRPEADVAALVHNWQADAVLTVGDNNYPDGEASTIDKNIGQYYQPYIYPYVGDYGPGAAGPNRFFPALGNHDWHPGHVQPYLDYFTLPGNERYYEVVLGPVHLFVLDSNGEEPDGFTADSIQAEWLQMQLAASTSPWKLVTLHHAPYSSGSNHGSDPARQWPYAEWGATAVLAGHEHTYERIMTDEIVYFVNGLGGRWRIHPFARTAVPGSAVRYNQDFGALLVTANETCLNFSFYNRSEELIDSYTVMMTDTHE
jgi:hypothetical protein